LLLLAQALELTTTEVIRRHLVDGFFLQRRADGACQFLDPTGCSVHAGRPLVCRIYPLGRSVSAGQEWFHAMAPVADSAGEWGETSTVQDYLEQQDALPSIEGVTLYLDLHAQLARGLATLPAASPDADVMTTAPGLSADTALDPDAAIAQYCARHQLTAPQEPMAKARCHALALTEWMDRQLEKLT
jgi:Fe-S-cluster containining protein